MPLRRPSFRQLQALSAVLETGSVTRAAERLHVSQPALSRLVAHLEEGVGYPLFRRVGGRVVPTAEAQLIYGEIQEALRSVDSVGRRMLQLSGAAGQTLSVSAFPAFATTTLPLVVSQFRQHQPGLRVCLSASNAVERMVDAVGMRGVDFAISNVPAHSAAVASEHLCRYATVCVVRRDHPFAKAGTVSLEDITRETLVSLVAQDDSQAIIDRAFQERGLEPDPAVEVSHCAAACAWVATAGGCTIVDPFTAGEWAGQLAQVNTDPPIWLDLWVISSRAHPMSRMATLCLEQLREHLGTLARMVHSG